MAGTLGQSKRLEGIKVNVTGNNKLGIQYTTHCQSYGWLAWSSNGEESGTRGEAKRLEAIKINMMCIIVCMHKATAGWHGQKTVHRQVRQDMLKDLKQFK